MPDITNNIRQFIDRWTDGQTDKLYTRILLVSIENILHMNNICYIIKFLTNRTLETKEKT